MGSNHPRRGVKARRITTMLNPNMAEGTGVEPARLALNSFRDYLRRRLSDCPSNLVDREGNRTLIYAVQTHRSPVELLALIFKLLNLSIG